MVQGYVNSATDKGARDYQEDRFIVNRVDNSKEKGWLLAVMDGHSGSEVAEFSEANLATYFKNFTDPVLSITIEGLKRALKLTIKVLSDSTKSMRSGCTLSIVYISETMAKAFVAVLGDSPVIIKHNKGLFIGPEHNVRTNQNDKRIVLQRGALYDPEGYMVDPNTGRGLQLTRALGDSYFDAYLIRRPQIFSLNLDKDSFVIVASDGLVDPNHKNDKDNIKGLVGILKNGGDALDLVRDALSRETHDNVTAVIWKQPAS